MLMHFFHLFPIPVALLYVGQEITSKRDWARTAEYLGTAIALSVSTHGTRVLAGPEYSQSPSTHRTEHSQSQSARRIQVLTCPKYSQDLSA